MKIFSYAYFVLAAVASAASPDDHPEGNTLRGLQGQGQGVNAECLRFCQFIFKNQLELKTAPDVCKEVVGVEPGELGECVSTLIAQANAIGFPKSAGQFCTKVCSGKFTL